MFSKKEKKFSDAECLAAAIIGGLAIAAILVGCVAPNLQTKIVVEKFTENRQILDSAQTVYNVIANDRTWCECTREQYINTPIGTEITLGYWQGTPKTAEKQ